MDSKPVKFVQLLLRDYVHIVSLEIYDMLMEEINNGAKWVRFEDIYGGECTMRSDELVSTRVQSPEAAERYKAWESDEF